MIGQGCWFDKLTNRSFDRLRNRRKGDVNLEGSHCGSDFYITDGHLWLSFQSHGPEYSRKAEHVLGLQVGGIGETVDFDRHHILSSTDIFRNVKLSEIAGILRETHILPVNP